VDVQEVRRTLFVPFYDDGLVSLSKFNGEHVMMINHDNWLRMSCCFVFFVFRQCIYPLVYPLKKIYIHTYKSCSMHSKGLLHKPNEIIPSLNSKIHSLGGSYDHLGVFYIWETGLFDITRACHFLQKLFKYMRISGPHLSSGC
jgi:hypothetical protein